MARSKGLNFRKAISLIEMVCDAAGSRDIAKDASTELHRADVIRAVREHDDKTIFAWLIHQASYQGISDQAADTWIDQNGIATAENIKRSLAGSRPKCDLLQSSFMAFKGCNYRKSEGTCSHPHLLKACPLPKIQMRTGSLSQSAYSLHMFFRDEAGGDFVKWVDEKISKAGDGASDAAEALIAPLTKVHGLSRKLVNMSLSTLLLGADKKRLHWQSVGANMVAVDSLVHAFLMRSGILRGLNAEHPYGPACYGGYQCATIIRHITSEIDARRFNNTYPKHFPRFVQQSIWRYCAQQHQNVCNGNRINDTYRCRQTFCILFDGCARLTLGRTPVKAAA